MRVVFLEDVEGVALGGDVKEVKNGFARNYLIPKSLAVPATHNALQKVKGLANQAEKDRVKLLSDLRELATHLEGVQINVEMRAGATGQLYGSVTNVMVAERLHELTEQEIDRRLIEIAEPIRELGKFDVNVRLHADVQTRISVLVYPIGKDPDEYAESLLAAELAKAEADAGEEQLTVDQAEAQDSDSSEATGADADDAAESEPGADEAPEEDAGEEESDDASSEENSGGNDETAEETESEEE
ncbi:MAG: 50S ribosomal protein L9 [Chloroflexi bacterium]|nr:50S ribosomal protein L9 [Chloroflexota bacterium]MCI0869365.1 50S ribosomal protein L9 [Chloroflexota bacterium]